MLLRRKHTENIMCIPMMLRCQVLSYVIVVELQVTRDRLHRTEEASHSEEEEEVHRRSPKLLRRLLQEGALALEVLLPQCWNRMQYHRPPPLLEDSVLEEQTVTP